MRDAERRISASEFVLVSWETMRSARRRMNAERRIAEGLREEPAPAACFSHLHLARDARARLTLCGRRPPSLRGLAILGTAAHFEERAASWLQSDFDHFEAKHDGGCVTCAAEAAMLTGEHKLLWRDLGAVCSCGDWWGKGERNERAGTEELHRDHVVRVCREGFGIRDEVMA